jgi:hypothetical protein
MLCIATTVEKKEIKKPLTLSTSFFEKERKKEDP